MRNCISFPNCDSSLSEKQTGNGLKIFLCNLYKFYVWTICFCLVGHMLDLSETPHVYKYEK